MAKRPVPKYDFKAFGAAIKAAQTWRKYTVGRIGALGLYQNGSL